MFQCTKVVSKRQSIVALRVISPSAVISCGIVPPAGSNSYISMALFSAVSCGSVPPAGSNSAVQGSPCTTYTCTVTYVCNTGYTTGSGLSLTCQANGGWSGSQGPDCTGMIKKYITFFECSHFSIGFFDLAILSIYKLLINMIRGNLNAMLHLLSIGFLISGSILRICFDSRIEWII